MPSPPHWSSRKVSSRNPRSSPWTSGSMRTSPSRLVSSRRGITGTSRKAPLAQGPPVLALVVLAVLAGADRPPPPLVLAIPLDGPAQALLEEDLGLPADRPRPVGGERVAAIVPQAVGDMGDERLVSAREREDRPHDVDVGQLLGPTQVVDAS